MCKIICLGKERGGTHLYKKFSIPYLFNARKVTFRTNFSVNVLQPKKQFNGH